MNEQWEHLHNDAMELSDLADQFRRDKDTENARVNYHRAMEKEREAALGYRSEADAKPATVAILLRSAATLALDAGEWREAEKLVGLALSGDVPPSIAEELRDLSENIYFRRHLELRNVVLSDNEVQLSLSGKGVSFGMIQSDDFLDRGEALQDLLYRAAERQSNQPYRNSGVVTPTLREKFTVFVSVPRASSFAVTYRVGTPEVNDVNESTLASELSTPDPLAILDEVITNLRLFDAEKIEELETRLEGSYLKNFLRQAKRLAPDGRRITQVGLTTQRGGKVEPLALRRTVVRQPRQPETQTAVYIGRVTEMKERDEAGSISITLQTENGERVSVLSGNVSNVSDYFLRTVRLTARKQKGQYLLMNITPL